MTGAKTSGRRKRARDYRGFPVEYAGLFLGFAGSGFASIGPLPERAARNLSYDLNIYKAALRTALQADPSDTYVRDLEEAARPTILRVEHPPGADADGWFVVIEPNPLVAAMAAGKVKYVRRSSPSASPSASEDENG